MATRSSDIHVEWHMKRASASCSRPPSSDCDRKYKLQMWKEGKRASWHWELNTTSRKSRWTTSMREWSCLYTTFLLTSVNNEISANTRQRLSVEEAAQKIIGRRFTALKEMIVETMERIRCTSVERCREISGCRHTDCMRVTRSMRRRIHRTSYIHRTPKCQFL